MDLQESHLTLPTITVCLDDSELSQLSAKPYGPFLCLRQVSQTIVRWKICFGGGAAPKQWEWGKKGICKESPKKGRSGGGERGGWWWRGGRGYIRKRCTFPVAFAAEKGKAKTEKPKADNEGGKCSFVQAELSSFTFCGLERPRAEA